MCGISAGNFKKNLSVAQKLKIKKNMIILGLYNESRGSHGCGMYINNEVIKGGLVDKLDLKLFKNFIAANSDIRYNTGNIIIHSRQATGGAHTPENNHPFHFTNDVDEIVGVHNGKIDNVYQLCTKNGLKGSDYSVDSQALLALILHQGWKILEQYEGFAALVMELKSDPDALYVYHGEYCKYKDDAKETAEVERPMFVLETSEGFYFSSMMESLVAISDHSKDEIYELNPNVVYRFFNGESVEGVCDINRLYGPNTKEKIVPYAHQPRNDIYDYDRTNKEFDKRIPHMLCLSELLPANIDADCDDRIFFWKGRYHTNANSTYPLATGKFPLTKKGYITDCRANDFEQILCFYEGVILKNSTMLDAIFAENDKDKVKGIQGMYNPMHINFVKTISKLSYFPVGGDENSYKYGSNINKWFLNGEEMKDSSVSYRFSNRGYRFKNGCLVEIKASLVNDIVFNEQRSVYDRKFNLVSELRLAITPVVKNALMQQIILSATLLGIETNEKEVEEIYNKDLSKVVLNKTNLRETFTLRDITPAYREYTDLEDLELEDFSGLLTIPEVPQSNVYIAEEFDFQKSTALQTYNAETNVFEDINPDQLVEPVFQQIMEDLEIPDEIQKEEFESFFRSTTVLLEELSDIGKMFVDIKLNISKKIGEIINEKIGVTKAELIDAFKDSPEYNNLKIELTKALSKTE